MKRFKNYVDKSTILTKKYQNIHENTKGKMKKIMKKRILVVYQL